MPERSPRRRKLAGWGALGVTAVVALAGCTGGSHGHPGSGPATGSGRAPSSGAPSSGTAPKKLTGVTVSGATITVHGKNGTMQGTIVNHGAAQRVTAITCACASRVQMGAPGSGRTVKPLPSGLALPKGGSVRFGTAKVVVELTGLFKEVKHGASVPVIVYLGPSAYVTGTATVG